MLGELFEHSLKFFGLFLYRGSSGKKVGYKPCHVFGTMAVIAAVGAVIIFDTIYENVNSVFKKNVVHFYSNILESLSTAIFYTVCASKTVVVQNKLFRIRAILDKVERNLQIKTPGIMKKNHAVFLILFHFLWLLLALFEVSIRITKYGTFLFIHLFKQYAQMYLSLCAFTFVLLVLQIFTLFRSLNNKLNNILKQSNNKRKTDKLSANQQESTLDTLSNSHWDLCEAMTKLGEAFGLQLLLIISYVYIKCITSPFKFLVSIFFPQTDAQTFFLVYFWWLFLYFSIAVVVFKVCTDTTIEARKTNVIVWDNVHEHHNLSIAEKLKTFSAKMNHNNYKFTACGFFVLELSTLSSMLLSVTTQLFILFSIIRQG